MRLTLMLMSLALVTVLMGSVAAVVTTNTTAEIPTGPTDAASGPAPSGTEPPVCAPGAPTLPALPSSRVATTGDAPAAHGRAPRQPPPTDVPCPSAGVPYSHSWYVTSADGLAGLGATDAKWLSQETALIACSREFLTVLDFGHPTRKYTGQTSPLDEYAMTLFGYRDTWRTYREIEQITERYLDAWMGAVSSCPRLVLVLGSNNFGECQYAAGACNVATAGQYWDVVAHDVMDYVTAKGFGGHVSGVWIGDDLETSWDPWATTARFLDGAQTQERTYSTHAQLVDYGDANVGVCSVVTGSCRGAWTTQNVFDAAWNIGWDLPLPELYSSSTAARWDSVARAFPTMEYRGVMTECGGDDPLPLDGCLPDRGEAGGATTGSQSCEWTPAIAYDYAARFSQAMSARHPPAYATNIQWLPTPGASASGTTDSTACG